MLTSLNASSFSRNAAAIITVVINGKAFEAQKGETILQICDRNGMKIPRLCYHPCLPSQGSCGICAVQVTDAKGEKISNACVTKCQNGMQIETRSQKVVNHVQGKLQKLLDVHDQQCTSCVAFKRCEFRKMIYSNGVSNTERAQPIPDTIDLSSPAVKIDPSKCVQCGRCVRACKNNSLKVLKVAKGKNGRTYVQTTDGRCLNETACISCGQCTLYCPVGAITEKSEVQHILAHVTGSKKHKLSVAHFTPGVKVGLAAAYKVPVEKISTGRIINALRLLGFDLVLDASFGSDIAMMEDATELANQIKAGNKDIIYTSTCPSWVKFAEQGDKKIIKNLSKTRSPGAITSGIVKNVIAKDRSIKDDEVFCVSFTPCLSKKEEIRRGQLGTENSIPDTDYALSVRELVELFKVAGIDVFEIPEDGKFDMFEGSGAGALSEITGGYLEGVLREAYQILNNKQMPNLEIEKLHGTAATKIVDVNMGVGKIKVAAIQGIANGAKFLEKVKKNDKSVKGIKFVEIIACQGGCVNGGGSVRPSSKATFEERQNELIKIDGESKIRVSQENPEVQAIYKNVFGKPNSLKAQEILHTHFTHRAGF